jgi:sugar phosphate permease
VLIGFTLYGPDALMTGAGAIEVGSRANATLAAGVINGMGQVGAVVQALAIGKLYDKLGGQLGPIFMLLVGSAVMATVLLGVVLIRNRMGRSAL